MKTFIRLVFVIAMQTLLVQAAIAEASRGALVPLPSLDDFTRGKDGWGLGLGLGVEYESAYEGSDEFEVEADPAGAVQWRKGPDIFYWAGAALGWRGLRSASWLFDAAVVFPVEEGREETDSKDGHLAGLGDVEGRTEIVLQARRALDPDWRYWLDGRLVAGEDGSLGIFGLGRRFGAQTDGTGSDLSLVLVLHDSDYANRDFGISAPQAASSGLEQTDLDGGFRSVGMNYTFRYFVSDNWQIFGEALYEHFSGDVRDSPIARSDYEAEVGVGAIYVF